MISVLMSLILYFYLERVPKEMEVEGGNEVNVVAPSTYHTSMSLLAATSRTTNEVGGGGGAWGSRDGMAGCACIDCRPARCDAIARAGLILQAGVLPNFA